MAAYTTIDNPELYFQAVTYTGNGSSQSVTLDGDENMQPDLVWVKNRSTTEHHVVYDSVRGVNKVIYPNQSNDEDSESNGVSSFDSDGYSMTNTNGALNGSGESMVAWCWKAGAGSGSSNEDGSINTTSTSVSTTAGFSISKYTGNETAGDTVGHGLGAVPQVIMVKKLSQNDDWFCYFESVLSNGSKISLNTTAASASASSYWNNTTPTSSVFTLGANGANNADGQTHVAYCFTEKQGYSKFGSYTGNGNADGPFVYTGFRPAFVLQKNAGNTQGWQLQDNKREGYNGDNDLLQPHDNAAESGVNRIDILSNGFKVITTDAGQNSSGTAYIYMAFAEAPFVNSEGVPGNAR